VGLVSSQSCSTPAADAVLKVGIDGTDYITIDPTADPSNADVSFSSSTVRIDGRDVLAELDDLAEAVSNMGTLFTGSPGPVCSGNRFITEALHLDNIVRACTKYDGSLTVSGDTIVNVNLGDMEEITGALIIGPSMSINTVVAPNLVELGSEVATGTGVAPPYMLYLEPNTVTVQTLDFPVLERIGGGGMRLGGGGSGSPAITLNVFNFPALVESAIGIGKLDSTVPDTVMSFPSLTTSTGSGHCAGYMAICFDRTLHGFTTLSMPNLVSSKGIRVIQTYGFTSLLFPSLASGSVQVEANSGFGSCGTTPEFDFGAITPSRCD
jgi:hypothetical protein